MALSSRETLLIGYLYLIHTQRGDDILIVIHIFFLEILLSPWSQRQACASAKFMEERAEAKLLARSSAVCVAMHPPTSRQNNIKTARKSRIFFMYAGHPFLKTSSYYIRCADKLQKPGRHTKAEERI